MISPEKRIILTPLQKLPNNVRDLGKLIVAKDFKKLPKVQKIAQSGHTADDIKALALSLSHLCYERGGKHNSNDLDEGDDDADDGVDDEHRQNVILESIV